MKLKAITILRSPPGKTLVQSLRLLIMSSRRRLLRTQLASTTRANTLRQSRLVRRLRPRALRTLINQRVLPTMITPRALHIRTIPRVLRTMINRRVLHTTINPRVLPTRIKRRVLPTQIKPTTPPLHLQKRVARQLRHLCRVRFKTGLLMLLQPQVLSSPSRMTPPRNMQMQRLRPSRRPAKTNLIQRNPARIASISRRSSPRWTTSINPSPTPKRRTRQMPSKKLPRRWATP